jgi:hypothetical protein
MNVQVASALPLDGTTHQCDDLVANKQRSHRFLLRRDSGGTSLAVHSDCTVHVIPIPGVQLTLLQLSGGCASIDVSTVDGGSGAGISTRPLDVNECAATTQRSALSGAFCSAPGPYRPVQPTKLALESCVPKLQVRCVCACVCWRERARALRRCRCVCCSVNTCRRVFARAYVLVSQSSARRACFLAACAVRVSKRFRLRDDDRVQVVLDPQRR